MMKVGIVVAGPRVPAWHAACIRALRAVDGVAIVVTTADAPPCRGDTFVKWLAGPALAPAAVQPETASLGDCDVVLDLTASRAATRARANVWSFQLGEDDDAAAPFVREIARGDETVRIALVRQAGARDDVLRTGRFAVTRLYASTLRWAMFEAAHWPAILAAALRDGLSLDAVACDAPAPRAALTVRERARFLLSRLAQMCSYPAQLFEVTEWNVGLVAADPRVLLGTEPLEVRWLARPAPFTFVADPFVVERDNRRVVFVEEYSYRRDRGVIEALELDAAGNIVRRDRVIDLPTHLSYPCPLELDGALYIVPENVAANEVVLYRCVEFPARWEREAATFPAFDGIDATLFEHDGRWWAFCTRASRGPMLALFAYHAASPRGPWIAHPFNPVVVDVTCARPAGRPFIVDGVLYRPGQDCAESYGGALAIARIDELTPQSYHETVVRRVSAHGFGRYARGIHTASIASGTIAIDGKHVYHDPRMLVRALRALLHKASRAFVRSRTKTGLDLPQTP